jgi:hypothetical protein
LVAGVAQGQRRFRFADDVDRGTAFAQFAAQVGKVGVAGDETESVGALVKQGFDRVQRECDVLGVFACSVLVLQAWCESESNQRFLPLVRECGVVSIASAQHHAAELGHDPQSKVQNFRRRVVAVHKNRNSRIHARVELCHGIAPLVFGSMIFAP